MKLKNIKEWSEYSKSGKRPADIPGLPGRVYKNQGWISMGDFMGTKNISNRYKKFISYKKAKAFVKKLKLKNQKEWNKYRKSGKLQSNIPSSPPRVYKNKGWKSWGDFLGTGTISFKLRKIRSFKSARAFARKLKIKTGFWIFRCY